jgi:hypothetical protein
MSGSNRDIAYGVAATAGVLLLMALAWIRSSQPQGANANPLGPYAEISTYCGRAGIADNVTTIPWVGCFRLHAGNSAEGTFAGKRLRIQVDASGAEHFSVNGLGIVNRIQKPGRTASGTNLPLVHAGGVGGYAFCRGGEPLNFCPSDIEVFTRAPDKSVVFTVAECLPPTYQVCVLTLENWRYEVSRRLRTGQQ